MESKGVEISRFNSQVLEGLRGRVDLLVNEFPFNFISRCDGPPEESVQPVSSRLHDSFWNVDVSALLDDFTVNKLGNLLGRVVLGTVELEGLGSGPFFHEHNFKSPTNINSL